MTIVIDNGEANQSRCRNCGDLFKYRSNKTFCSPKCRKSHHKSQIRETAKGSGRVSSNQMTRDEVRNREEEYALLHVLAEKLYTLAPSERLGYVEDILQIAKVQRGGLLRRVLSNRTFIYPDPDKTRLFYRQSPKSYCTFPQACNRYLLTSPHKCYLRDFLRGVPEPLTGEVLEDDTINIKIDAKGWTEFQSAFNNKRSGGKKNNHKKFVLDTEGQYIHPWYFKCHGFERTKVEVLKVA